MSIGPCRPRDDQFHLLLPAALPIPPCVVSSAVSLMRGDKHLVQSYLWRAALTSVLGRFKGLGWHQYWMRGNTTTDTKCHVLTLLSLCREVLKRGCLTVHAAVLFIRRWSVVKGCPAEWYDLHPFKIFSFCFLALRVNPAVLCILLVWWFLKSKVCFHFWSNKMLICSIGPKLFWTFPSCNDLVITFSTKQLIVCFFRK